jgi:hypothetical protein
MKKSAFSAIQNWINMAISRIAISESRKKAAKTTTHILINKNLLKQLTTYQLVL